MHAGEYVRVIAAASALVVAAVEVPEPAIEQVAEPIAVKAPGGIVIVQVTCVPETAPASVPLNVCLMLPSSTTRVRAPVELEPFCVAIQLAAILSLLLGGPPNVPVHVPLKLRVPAGTDGPVGDELPHPETNAARTVRTENRTTPVRNVIPAPQMLTAELP
jgi:hypothetical protein